MMIGTPHNVPINVIYVAKRLVDEFGGLHYNRVGDAGFDLRACFDLCDHEKAFQRPGEEGGWGPVTLKIPAGGTVTVSAGFKIEVPLGYQANIHPRGGQGTKGLVIGNLTGVIDAGYQGEVFINLWNRTGKDMEIQAFERVAQMVINPVCTGVFNAVTEFTTTSERGEGKLSSSGTM